MCNAGEIRYDSEPATVTEFATKVEFATKRKIVGVDADGWLY
jgi:hypothetical protein